RFTFGRSPGPPFEHVQILAPTVSRLHAYMEYVDGQWYIGNLSFTNAVLVNGRPVVGEETVLLRDGDYVEMGEVVFVFRERGGWSRRSHSRRRSTRSPGSGRRTRMPSSCRTCRAGGSFSPSPMGWAGTRRARSRAAWRSRR